MRTIALLSLSLVFAGLAAAQDRTASPAGAQTYFIAPRAGAKVSSPVTVRFGLKGMGIAPAGVKLDNTGHFHLLIDTDFSDVKADAALPVTDKILHFGKGQTETEVKLAPGKHTLQIVLGDAAHVPHNPAVVSKKISITVTQ